MHILLIFIKFTSHNSGRDKVAETSQSESAESAIKKFERGDASGLELLNATYAHTAFPSTNERAQLATVLSMSSRRVKAQPVHAFVYLLYIVFIFLTFQAFPLVFRIKSSRPARDLPIEQGAAHPILVPLDFIMAATDL